MLFVNMNKTHRVYLLLGPEEGEKKKFLHQVKTTIQEKAKEPPEEVRLYALETPVYDLVSLLKNGSLFSAHRIVYVHDVEDIKKKEELSLLTDYIKNPSEDNTVFLISTSTQVDRRLQAALPQEQVKIFWELFDNQKRTWIVGFFKQYKITIEQDALDLFLDMIASNTEEFKNECTKLALFFGNGSTIREQDIETYLYHSKEENVFTLFEPIMECDLENALHIMQKILLSGESNSVQIMSGILWQFRIFFAYKRLIVQNYGSIEAFSKLNVKSKKAQKVYALGDSRYSVAEIERIIVLINDFDFQIRSARAELHGMLLDLFLYFCICKKGIIAGWHDPLPEMA